MAFCSLPRMSPKEAPMISLLEDIQIRLDAGVIVKFNKPRSRVGERCWTSYTCSAANIQEGSIRLKLSRVRRVPVNDGCSLRT
jgi:hypothetical protein